MSDFVFACPLCGKELVCEDALENQVVKCPECGGEIVPERPAKPPVPPRPTGQTRPTRPTNPTRPTGQTRPTSPPQTAEFKRPILTTVFNAVGVVHLILGVLCGFLGATNHEPLAVVYGAAIAAASVFPFGIAQIVYFIARISFNTERTVELLKRK